MSSIRVVLTITLASQELFAGLKEVPARLRAERVRTLATIGLAAVAGGIVGAKPAISAPIPDNNHAPRLPHRAL